MCNVIGFDDIKKSSGGCDDDNQLEHQVISFTEMNNGIDDARILHAKISLFAKKLIEEGFDDYTVYMQLFKTAKSMSALYSDNHEFFAKEAHDHLTAQLDYLCCDRLGIDHD